MTGEFDIIERYFAGPVSTTSENVVLGPGDDCAILDVPADADLAVSTDTLVSGVHFPTDAPAAVVAHRSLAANLSDLAAMGAAPLAFTLAMTMPDANESWLESFSGALAKLAGDFEIPLVGGNLSRGQLSLTLAVMGTLPKGQSLRRSGATVGDDVYATGTLGDAAGGLLLLQRGEPAAGQLIERYYYPTPRLELGRQLLGIATAAVDVSDGLSADLAHLCKRSGVGARVALSALPLSAALLERFPRDEATSLAVSSGDDYELCFTAASRHRERIAGIAASVGVAVTRIGVTEAGSRPAFVDEAGESVHFEASGYQHFGGG